MYWLQIQNRREWVDNKYNIVMFAYNEEKNIEDSIKSIFNNVDTRLSKFYILANGCTDSTISIAKTVKKKLKFEKLSVIEISEGDKCNAWNTYVHSIADSSDVHFFVDADVNFTNKSFPLMFDQLIAQGEQTVVIAGVPQSGRNQNLYRSFIVERACFFGNLYGMKVSFINRIKNDGFYLPKGLNWIDSFLTKAVNTDLQFFDYNLANRTTYLDDVGYSFKSLSPFKRSDITLFFNRIARYELGKLQEKFLDAIPVNKWPKDMYEINHKIKSDFRVQTANLSWFKTLLVKKRLNKILK